MERWALLKRALNGQRDESSSSSIHRHNGFKLIPKKFTVWTWCVEYEISVDSTWSEMLESIRVRMAAADCSEVKVNIKANRTALLQKAKTVIDEGVSEGILRVQGDSIFAHDPSFQPFLPNAKYYRYHLPCIYPAMHTEHANDISELGSPENVSDKSVEVKHLSLECFPEDCVVFTREKAVDAAVGVSELLSHLVHGVDNTGNVKVWASESMLLHVLLRNVFYIEDFANKRVLELGGGLTGLCSLGLAASLSHSCEEIVCTDGHPSCVANQRVCIAMCEQSNCLRKGVKLSAHQLRWLSNDPHGELRSLTQNYTCLFDRIVASDCLFFKDFHDDLVWLLSNALSSNGIVYMLQPNRGNTMRIFLEKATSVFDVTVTASYDSAISELHEEFVRAKDSTGYDPDIHYPVLVTLTLKRSDVA